MPVSNNNRQSTPSIDGNLAGTNNKRQPLNNSRLSHSTVENAAYPEFDDHIVSQVDLTADLEMDAINPLVLSVSISYVFDHLRSDLFIINE